VIARFEAERQALALMDHPNIARVFDAGATETGRPFFVMELVQGVSITEYCDQNSLSTKERLALFLQVCQAVQHAHQKGIIHRDIKPSNVMVALQDGKPVPKVIDFGIAKATNQKLTEKTLFTRYAHIIGTPAYMSPEQAELSDLDIDTRSDIYSLGVLLYELLTGTTPFSEEELRKAGYTEMQRVIREQEPAKPSTKLSTLGNTLTNIAKHRGCTPDLLRKAVRGDLDWIVMKSLEKDRARRYEAAESLALDIQRHLEHRPVSARAPSNVYRLHKFLRRHRVQTLVVSILAVVAAVAIVVVTRWNRDRFQLAQAERFRHEEILSKARPFFAKEEHAKALELVESILDSRHVGPAARLLTDQILNDLRERATRCTQRIEADPMDASAYSARAEYYDCLHDRISANADMMRWSAVQCHRAFWDCCFGPAWNLKRVIDGPSGYQLVFSAERPVSKTPVLLIAFGQKGRWEMKLLEIPLFLASLLAFGLSSSIDAPGARADFTFGEPVELKSVIPVLDPANDWVMCLSYDGLELYICRGRPGWQGGDLWVLKRGSTDEDWGAPEKLGPGVNSPSDPSFTCGAISRDGLTLYFDGIRPGGYGGSDIFVTTRVAKDAPWAQAVNMGPKVNSSAHDECPWISPDGLELYFVSERPGGYGGRDIWVARRETVNSPWADPLNLGPRVNSPYSEVYISLSPDGRLLFFDEPTAGPFRPGGYGGCDLWMARRATLSDPWQAPVNLGPKVNGPSIDGLARLSPDGRMLYYNSGPGDPTTVVSYRAPVVPVVDFNADKKVDLVDLVMLIEDWGKSESVCDIGPMPWGDGKVDIEDLKVFMTYYEKENPPKPKDAQ
jgi:hypothetical protein